jgi:hypothetical protein
MGRLEVETSEGGADWRPGLQRTTLPVPPRCRRWAKGKACRNGEGSAGLEQKDARASLVEEE